MFFVAKSVLWKFTMFCCDLQAFVWRKTLLRILPQKQSHYCKTFDQLIFYRWPLWSPNLTSEMGFMAVFGCKKQWHTPRPNFTAKSWSMPQKPVRKYGSAAWRILWGQCLFFKSLQRAEGGGGSRACLAVRITAKNGDHPGAGKYGRSDFALGRWANRDQNAAKCLRAHAKDAGELVRICFRSPSSHFSWGHPSLLSKLYLNLYSKLNCGLD